MFNLRALPSDLARKATNELNEDREQIAHHLRALRAWLEKQPHLRARNTDQFLIAFLRGSKYSLEKAKQKLENFYVHRAMVPEMYENREFNTAKLEALVRAGSILFLPTPTSIDGPIVVIVRPSHFNMAIHNIPEMLKVAAMMADILLEENDNAIIAGYVFIMDLGNIPKSVLLNFDAEFVKKITVFANKAAPTRMKGFHFFNVLPIFEKLFGMMKGVISSKLKERFYVHGSNCSSLYQHVPRHILPKEYGGDCDIGVIQQHWWQKLNDYKDYLQEESQYGLVKEYMKQRNVKQAANGSVDYGIEGSFRQLEFD